MAKKKVRKKKLLDAIFEIGSDGFEQVRCPHCNSWDAHWSGKYPGDTTCTECQKELRIPPWTHEIELEILRGRYKAARERSDSQSGEIWDLKKRIAELEKTPWSKIKAKIDVLKKKYDLHKLKAAAVTTGLKLRDRFLFRWTNRLLVEHVYVGKAKADVYTSVHPPTVTLKVIPIRIGKLLGYQSFRAQYRKDYVDGWLRVCSKREGVTKGFEKYLNKVVHDHKEGL